MPQTPDMELELPVFPKRGPDPRTEPHGIKVQYGVTPQQLGVWIDGQDISTQVMRVQIDADAGDLTVITLTLLNADRQPVTIEGTFRVVPGALEGIV